MNDFFTSIRQQFAAASTGSKIALAIGICALVAVGMFANSLASRPSFSLLYSNLDARTAASVQSALAGANVRYQVSQPPGPFVIHVDETQYYVAQNAVAVSGALESAPEGIQTNGGGAAQVFLSAGERAQNSLKREWQEMEKQLEELEFVQRAHVSSSSVDPSPLRKTAPMTVAVMLTLKGGSELTKSQMQTVAKLVRYRFNVPMENVMVSDQAGRSLYDGASSSDLGSATADLFDHGRRHDDELAKKTNQILDRVFGPGMAYVVLSSDWTFAELESVKEVLDPKNKVVTNETLNKTSTPIEGAPNAGGIAGASSNLNAEFGSSNAAINPVASDSGSEKMAQSTESTKSTIVGRETRLERSNAPKLNKISVSLFLDDSQKDRLKDLESSVKASIGFVDTRDTFSSMVTPFASIKRDDKGQIVPPAPAAEVSAPSRMTEMLIQRGIEIGAAAVFLFLLFKTLKGAAKGSASKSNAGGIAALSSADGGEATMDGRAIEMLAKTEIEELVKTDPARVSSILSRWAAEEEQAVGAGR